MAIYLACYAMDPEGPDVFAEPLATCIAPSRSPARRLAARFAPARAERSPAMRGRPCAMRAIVAAGVARPRRCGRCARGGGGGAVGHLGAAVVLRRVVMDWLHKHQGTCRRALFRTFEELRKIRRDFGDDWPDDEGSAEEAAPDPVADAGPGGVSDEGAGAPRRTPGAEP